MGAIAAATAVTNGTPQPTLGDRIFFQLITQIAVRVLFPFGVMVLLASVLPLRFFAVVLTGAVIGAAFLASHFFQPEPCICPRPPKEPVSFLTGEKMPPLHALEPLPPGHPRGIWGGVNGCWLNAVLQVVRIVPSLNGWIRNSNLASFQQFYAAYDTAVANGQRVVNALPQLRRELNMSTENQEDAQQGLLTLLRDLPLELQGTMTETRHYNTDEHGPISTLSPPNQLPAHQFTLSFPESVQPIPVETLLSSYFNDRGPHQPANQPDSGGVFHPYPINRVERMIIEPPAVLILSLNRFRWVQPEVQPTLVSRVFQLFLPASHDPLRPSASYPVKVETPILVNDLLQLPTANGSVPYQLKAFFVHCNSKTPRSGHYVAFGKENGACYSYNDSFIARAEGEWEAQKSQAYVLVFERAQ